jgi:hypothetical protein
MKLDRAKKILGDIAVQWRSSTLNFLLASLFSLLYLCRIGHQNNVIKAIGFVAHRAARTPLDLTGWSITPSGPASPTNRIVGEMRERFDKHQTAVVDGFLRFHEHHWSVLPLSDYIAGTISA